MKKGFFLFLVLAAIVAGHLYSHPDSETHRHIKPFSDVQPSILALQMLHESLNDLQTTRLMQDEELRYYERTHSVRDEGYNAVMACWQRLTEQISATDSVRRVLLAAIEQGDPLLPQRLAFMRDLTALPAARRAEADFQDFVHRLDAELKPHASIEAPLQGTLRDSTGTYTGSLSADTLPQGYGIWHGNDGSYYEGRWQAGRRHGFGYALPHRGIVQCGTWRRGRFHGERAVHTADHVYGIDISRYQHEIGRRQYPILWKGLRITSLGAKITGEADSYPVSFIYIKVTQGTTIQSRYYTADARAARRAGFSVGAYHFFSPIGGAEQANYFLKTAQPQRGDLPPMLDVELTNKQIAKMGGEEALFREMLVWLRRVERHTGTRPLLYVGQNFVNRHLVNAPAELQAYPVWVARYGEFRPYVRLNFWQLAATGRVNGITGSVDIDVFNGTREMFEEWKRENAVRN